MSLNLTTGVATTLFATGFMAGSLSYAPDGNLYAGSSTGEIYLVNPSAQTVTPFLATGYPGDITGLTLGNNTASASVTANPATTLTPPPLSADTVGVATGSPFHFTVTATDNDGGTVSHAYTLTVLA